MLIDNNEIIKYFDLVIKDIRDVDVFSINNTLIDNNRIKTSTDIEQEYFFRLVENLKKFGIRNEYLEPLEGSANSWFRLTKKGVQLKEFKKGHLKFNKSLQPKKLTFFEKLSVLFIFISGCFAFWQQYSKDELKNDYKILKIQYDALKFQLDSCKSVSDSYKFRLDSILYLQAKQNLKKDRQ